MQVTVNDLGTIAVQQPACQLCAHAAHLIEAVLAGRRHAILDARPCEALDLLNDTGWMMFKYRFAVSSPALHCVLQTDYIISHPQRARHG